MARPKFEGANMGPITVSLSESDRDWLKTKSDKEDRSVSAVVRRVIRDARAQEGA